MAKPRKQLLLRIEQDGNVTQRKIGRKEKLSIGQSQKNDIRLNGEDFPKKHVLFAGKNNHFEIKVNQMTRGEVYAGDSCLNFNDLIAHDLLPRKGTSFTYPITAGRKGIVQMGDTRITFHCTEVQEVPEPILPKFEGYSWFYATYKNLGQDLMFKVVLLTVVILNTVFLSYMRGLPLDIKPSGNGPNAVPQRLARIIMKTPAVDIEQAHGRQSVDAGEEPEESGEEAESNSAEKAQREVKPENTGLLGLLTGSGKSSQSNGLADFLLDKGLVDDLDEVLSSTDLSLGQGSSNKSDDFDNLIAQSDLGGGGIDDIVGDVNNDVQSVGFGEKGNVKVDQIGSMTGSAAALGQRSEASVRRVQQRNAGRMSYIYSKHLKRNPDMRGKMVVEVVIAADGSVDEVKLITSTIGNQDFEREILNFVRRWKYDPIDQGKVTVTYPFFFSRVG